MMVSLIFLPFLVCLGTSSASLDWFYFTKHPQSQVAVSGKPVRLECQVSHAENIIYYWDLNGTRLTNTTRRHQIGSDLYITRADHVLDAGEFSCIADNVISLNSKKSSAATLNVVWLGEHAAVVQAAGADGEVRPGGELVLRCVIDGNGEIKYDWFRNGEQLVKSERITLKNKKLHIKEVSASDNGVYRCKAHNDAGERESKSNFVLRIRSPKHPLIQVVPRDATVRQGEDVKFECVFEDADEIRWYLSQELIRNEPRRIVSNGSIAISDIGASDEGLYTCTGIKKDNEGVEERQSYSASLTISYIKDLTMKSFEPELTSTAVVAPAMKPFEKTCLPPEAVPAPSVWWQDPSGRNISDTGLIRVDGTVLSLESPRVESDSGNYTCFAQNKAGTTKFSFQLIISVAPTVPTEPAEVRVDEGHSHTFQCQYKGSPYPATTVRWKKDDKYLNPNRGIIKENGALELTRLQPSDRGIYVCEVNTTGFEPVNSKPYKLNVIDKLKFTPRPVSKKLELGVATKIPCKAQGSPTPVIQWLKENPSQFPPHIQDINGTLYFNSVHMSDKGRYTCVATSTQGTINVTVDIDVIVAPQFKIKPQNPTEALEGYRVMLHCSADGFPSPTIRWDKNGEMNGLEDRRFQVLENGTLVVHDVSMEDNGNKYGCTAGNSGGLKREEALLIVRRADDFQPSDMTEGEESMMTKTVTITLSAAAAYMVLVIGLMVWCRYRRRKRKQAYLSANPEGILLGKAENGDVGVANGDRHDACDLKPRQENGRRSDGTETMHSQSSGQSKKSSKSNNYEKLAFSRQSLIDLKLIGHGMFGQVFVARTENAESPVIVKSLQNTRDENVLIEFKRETDMFHRLCHDNVVKIVGLCREAEPHYMVLEYSDWGELKHFLHTTKKERSKLSTSQIVDIAKQISIGMEHLSNARFLHKDLAARNCVIASDLRVKVSLIALSKDVYSNDYTQFRNQLIPLRWLSFEAVFEDDYSTKSDVYSFAALCWELFHQGERPFFNLADSVVIERLQRKELVIKPSKSAPPKMATLLTSCASSSPKDRPTFSNIAIVLGETLQDL